MSVDLETLLRDAAGGPVAPPDTVALRRAGRRRRHVVRGALTAGVAVVAVAGGMSVAAVLPDPATLPPVLDAPDEPVPEPEPEPPVDDGDVEKGVPGDATGGAAADAVDGAPVELAVERAGDRCQLRISLDVPDGRRSGALWLPDGRGEWCEDDPDEVELARVDMMMTFRAPGADGSLHPEQLLAGLVDPDVVAVRVRTDLADVTVRTVEVTTPGALEFRAFGVLVPIADGADVPEDRRYTSVRADGTVDREVAPTYALFDLAWTSGPGSDGSDGEPGYATTGQPIDDVPIELPDEVPPLGAWRPEPSPVDLSPLSMRNTADAWYMNEDPYEPAYPVAREVVAERLGGEPLLVELCAFLEAEVDRALTEVEVPEGERELVPETVTHLVMAEAGVVGGDGMTATVAHTCGLVDAFGTG